jgi:hypothetical protein
VSAAVLAFILWFQGASAVQSGVVTGQLQAVEGTPAIGVWVAAVPLPANNAVPADGPQYYSPPVPVSETLTDNRGRYRLANIPPGRYHIIAGVIGDATYFPAATAPAGATLLTVAAGSTTGNIDFKLLKPFGRKVAGRVKPNTPDTRLTATLVGGKLEDVLQVPVGSDGSFDFGHIPPGAYSLGLFPTPPGFASFPLDVGEKDISELELVLPPTRNVTGRIVVQNGPLPRALLEFSSARGYIAGATINPDLTFTTRLHPARHRVELAGMPVGYAVTSVRVGSQDATQGFVVENADLSGVVITVAAPRRLPAVRGRIAGLAATRLSSTKVALTGPIIGSLEAIPKQDGSFEFPAVIPGLYKLALMNAPEIPPVNLVVAGFDATEVQVAVPAR